MESRTRDGRFAPGHSGNPGGRPPGRSFASVIAEQLEELRRGATTRERIVAATVARALKGDMAAVQWLADRSDGKVKDTTEHSGELVVRVLRDRVG